jgi:hypothetical protein
MLDTLMNVVGILVIVLVAVQISSQEAATRIAEAIADIDPAEVARLEHKVDAATKQAAKASAAIREVRQSPHDPRAESARLRSELQIEEDLAREAEARARALEEAAAKQAAAHGAQAQTANAKVAQAQERIRASEARQAELERELKGLPQIAAPPAKSVRLPNPRPAPPGTVPMNVLCREGKIWVVDIPALQAKPQRRADFVVRSKNLDPDGDKWISDGKTLVDEFNVSPVRDGGFEITLAVANGRWPVLVLTRTKGGGETVEQALKSTGDFARMLRRLDPKSHILRFMVWPDSFETYLQARERAADAGFAAGWEPMTTPAEHQIPLGKYQIGTKPPPKPPDPNRPPAPPPPNVLD